MRIESITKHSAVMKVDGMEILFSYEHPVAVRNLKTGNAFRTSDFFSDTTHLDILKWLGDDYAKSIKLLQREIEKIAEDARGSECER